MLLKANSCVVSSLAVHGLGGGLSVRQAVAVRKTSSADASFWAYHPLGLPLVCLTRPPTPPQHKSLDLFELAVCGLDAATSQWQKSRDVHASMQREAISQ